MPFANNDFIILASHLIKFKMHKHTFAKALEMKRYAWLILLMIAVYSCKNSDNFTIEGMITNANSDFVYLEKLELAGPTPVDSVKLNTDGSFKLSGAVSEPTFFLLKLNPVKFVTLLVDSTDHINFSADYINYTKAYKIEGSLGSEQVAKLNKQLQMTNLRIDSIKTIVNLSKKDKNFNERLAGWQNEIDTIKAKQIAFSTKFVNDNPFSLASVLAIYQKFNDGSFVIQDLQTIKVAASALHSMYPKSTHTQALYEDTKRMMKRSNEIQMKQMIEKYGQNSPDITLENAYGKEVTLSDFRGKHVLLQFWASYDRASRIQNPVLKENYKKFKRKGFEIYQVSVDSLKGDWLQAVEEDQLNWTNVSIINSDYSALMKFNVNHIPMNYLLDEEGNIIGKDLQGPALHAKLNEILN